MNASSEDIPLALFVVLTNTKNRKVSGFRRFQVSGEKNKTPKTYKTFLNEHAPKGYHSNNTNSCCEL